MLLSALSVVAGSWRRRWRGFAVVTVTVAVAVEAELDDRECVAEVDVAVTVDVERGSLLVGEVNRVHNLIGVSKETTGSKTTSLALDRLREYGTDYHTAFADSIRKERAEREFRVEADSLELLADRVALTTGIRDRPPTLNGLKQYTGHGLHYCLHCDAYDLVDEPAFVFGHIEEAASVAMIFLNFTTDVDLLLNGESPTWNEEVTQQLHAHTVDIVETEAVDVTPDDPERTSPGSAVSKSRMGLPVSTQAGSRCTGPTTTHSSPVN